MKDKKPKKEEKLIHVSPRLARWLVALRLARFSAMGKRKEKPPVTPQEKAHDQIQEAL
jgi:hypothetical protein